MSGNWGSQPHDRSRKPERVLYWLELRAAEAAEKRDHSLAPYSHHDPLDDAFASPVPPCLTDAEELKPHEVIELLRQIDEGREARGRLQTRYGPLRPSLLPPSTREE